MKILVFDDEKAYRDMLTNFLSSLGHKVLRAENLEQSRSIAESENIDVAFLDMRAQDTDGIEVLKVLKKINPRTKCFFITGYDDEDAKKSASENRADGYILKPFRFDDIKETLRNPPKK